MWQARPQTASLGAGGFEFIGLGGHTASQLGAEGEAVEEGLVWFDIID